MKLWILSDLHLTDKSPQLSLDAPEHDVMVCAGDVREDLVETIDTLEALTSQPTILTAGNHEYFRFEGKALTTVIKRGERKAANTNIHLLENKKVIIDDVRFLGCTLWTDYELLGPHVQCLAMEIGKECVRDHRMIKLKTRGKRAKRFHPLDAWDIHKASRRWLERTLAEPHEGPTVVVTHHAPHLGSAPPDFAKDISAPSFVSHIPELVEGPNAPDLWIHGHTHIAHDYPAGSCRVICNPVGHKDENTGAELGLVIDI